MIEGVETSPDALPDAIQGKVAKYNAGNLETEELLSDLSDQHRSPKKIRVGRRAP